MYGSYGSYSSMSMAAMSAPLSIPFNSIKSHDSSCAYPSWPRRSSLSESDLEEPRATSYLSDDDLVLPDPFDDDSHSVSSSSGSSSPATITMNSPCRATDEEFLRRENERRAADRQEFIRQIKLEKERRRQMALKARKGSPKKASKMQQASLTTITE